MKTISMLELRQNSETFFNDLKRGLSLTLTYRGKKLALITPYEESEIGNLKNDPFFSICEKSLESPLGNLAHEDEDNLLYNL